MPIQRRITLYWTVDNPNFDDETHPDYHKFRVWQQRYNWIKNRFTMPVLRYPYDEGKTGEQLYTETQIQQGTLPQIEPGTDWTELYNPDDQSDVRRRIMIEQDALPPQEVSEPMLDLD